MDEGELKRSYVGIAQDAADLATDLRSARARILDIAIEQQVSVLRDATTLSLAGLGAIVTLLTVPNAKELIQTTAFFYVAAILFVIATIYSQWAREKLIDYHSNLRLEHERDYAAVKMPASTLLRDPLNGDTLNNLTYALKAQQGVYLSGITSKAYRYTYRIALAGILLLASSLVFMVRLPV